MTMQQWPNFSCKPERERERQGNSPLKESQKNYDKRKTLFSKWTQIVEIDTTPFNNTLQWRCKTKETRCSWMVGIYWCHLDTLCSKVMLSPFNMILPRRERRNMDVDQESTLISVKSQLSGGHTNTHAHTNTLFSGGKCDTKRKPLKRILCRCVASIDVHEFSAVHVSGRHQERWIK